MDGRDVSSQMDWSLRTSQETKTALNLGWSAPGREADVQPAGHPGQQQEEASTNHLSRILVTTATPR